ncbi:uncharacterized protein geminin [Chelonus insularis]|uniref:uncharacterized protein geminin n=1 Tax=Chelonus insularis TaxID=460826 RepID=UPI001589590F|nr:uncharacterized protein LOC118071303 [Chelonus insularis]
MKEGSTNTASTLHTVTSEQEKIKKPLHTLQPTATDKENLVAGGRALRSSVSSKGSVKDEMSEKMKSEVLKKDNKKTVKKNTVIVQKDKITCKDKACQTARGEKIMIEIEDLTSEAGPSENYWQVLAERRRIALDDALEENRDLSEKVIKLEEENRIYREMLDESRALVEVLQEMIGEDRNDINNSLEDSVL